MHGFARRNHFSFRNLKCRRPHKKNLLSDSNLCGIGAYQQKRTDFWFVTQILVKECVTADSFEFGRLGTNLEQFDAVCDNQQGHPQ
jgi:hypothetical protein